MNLDARALFAPLLALAILGVVITQTSSALKKSGIWEARVPAAAVRSDDPYVRLDRVLGAADPGVPAGGLRDPLAFGAAPTPEHGRPVVHVVKPPPPPRPQLTAIIWDNDPRAQIRYNDHEYSVRENTSFAEFRVVSITRDHVVLNRGGETLILRLSGKGE